MTQILVIMIIFFVILSMIFMIKIKNITLKIAKLKELNNQENPLETKYQFIKGLY